MFFVVKDSMKKAFTLVELLIVVAVLGILASIAVPVFQDYIKEAKESAAKDDLRILRNVISVYAAQHNNAPPGYADDDVSGTPGMIILLLQLRSTKLLTDMPKNPFNGLKYINTIANNDDMPAEATGENGWLYKPSSKQFRLDWPGTDSKGVRYYDY